MFRRGIIPLLILGIAFWWGHARSTFFSRISVFALMILFQVIQDRGGHFWVFNLWGISCYKVEPSFRTPAILWGCWGRRTGSSTIWCKSEKRLIDWLQNSTFLEILSDHYLIHFGEKVLNAILILDVVEDHESLTRGRNKSRNIPGTKWKCYG